MKKWKKTSTVLTAVLTASTLLAGCGNGGGSGESDTQGDAGTQTQTSGTQGQTSGTQDGASHQIGDGNVTLTIFCDFQNAARSYYTDLGDNPVVQWIEKDTGLNLEFIHAPAGYKCTDNAFPDIYNPLSPVLCCDSFRERPYPAEIPYRPASVGSGRAYSGRI